MPMIPAALLRWTAAAMLLVLPAWSAAQAQSQDMADPERTVSVNGVERSYVVYVPQSAKSPAPVVMLFHGGGGRPEAIARQTGMDELADQQGFLTVYPEGATRASGRGETWNVGGPKSPSSADDVAFVQAIVRDLDRTMQIDHARIYATGLSMGGVFAYRLACELSDTFAAIAPVSATMTEPSCHPSSPVAILHIHGTDDNRIPLSGGHGELTAADRSWPAPQQGITSWSRFDGCAEQPTRSQDSFADCTSYGQCRAPVEFCAISGGRHGWPPGASERIWAFFAANPKQAR